MDGIKFLALFQLMILKMLLLDNISHESNKEGREMKKTDQIDNLYYLQKRSNNFITIYIWTKSFFRIN